MGRSRKKAAARRRAGELARAAIAGLPTLAPTPRREKDGRTPRADKPDRMAASVALNARARQMGWADASKAAAQTLEGPSGRALHLACDPEELRALWDTWSRFRAARLAYGRRIIGVLPYAQTAKLEMMPERMEVRDDDKPDLRGEGEKDEDARRRWATWRDRLARLPPRHRDALRDAVAETAELVRDAALTLAGAIFVDALRELHKAVDK